jgi:pyrophosphatase PpaX
MPRPRELVGDHRLPRPADPVATEVVLFDLDGTLLDSVPLILDSFRHTFDCVGIPRPDAPTLMYGLGIPLRSYFARWVSRPDQLEEMIGIYRQYNLVHHDERVTAFPGVVDMVSATRASGRRTAIVTSKNRATSERGLRCIGLTDAIDVIVSCDDVVRPKPDREPVDRALRWLSAPAGAAVFVGDSLHDLASGRAAGVRTAAALWGPFRRDDLEVGAPDYWLEAPSDLLRVLNLEDPGRP